jgi:hypothetical protein
MRLFNEYLLSIMLLKSLFLIYRCVNQSHITYVEIIYYYYLQHYFTTLTGDRFDRHQIPVGV